MLVGDNDLYRTSTSELDTGGGRSGRTMNAKPPHPLSCALVRVIRERKAPASPHGHIERHDDDVLHNCRHGAVANILVCNSFLFALPSIEGKPHAYDMRQPA